MKNTISKVAAIMMVSLVCSIVIPACTKIKDLEPESELTPATFWKKEDDALAALAGETGVTGYS
jgi:hypothetical protein